MGVGKGCGLDVGKGDGFDGRCCWICGGMGHPQYRCPGLSQEERTAVKSMSEEEQRDFARKSKRKFRAEVGADGTVDNIDAAVHAQLGHYVDSAEDKNKKDNVFDDTDSDEDDDGTDSDMETFSFCQISVISPGVTNDMESSGIPGVQRLWDNEESSEIPGVQGLWEDGSVTSKINSG